MSETRTRKLTKIAIRAGYAEAAKRVGEWVPVADGVEVRADRQYARPGQLARFEWKFLYSARIAGVGHGWGAGRADAVDFTHRQLARVECVQ